MSRGLAVVCALALCGCAWRNPVSAGRIGELHPGLTSQEVAAAIGPSTVKASFADGSRSWTYRYYDLGVTKLLHVDFGADGRVAGYRTEWDPDVYSRTD